MTVTNYLIHIFMECNDNVKNICACAYLPSVLLQVLFKLYAFISVCIHVCAFCC